MNWFWQRLHWKNFISVSSLLPVSLGVGGEGDLLAAALSDDDLSMVEGVDGIDELGNVEALVLNLVLALGDGDILGDHVVVGNRVVGGVVNH